MTLARKRPQRVRQPTRRAARKPARTVLDTRQALERIDARMRELEALRRQLLLPLDTMLPYALLRGVDPTVKRSFEQIRQGVWLA